MNQQTEEQGHLYFLIGIARSGKSTLAKQWENYEIDIWTSCKNKKRVVINADSIRRALSGDRYNSYTEQFVAASKTLMARTLLSQGYSVLLDETHTTSSSIKDAFLLDNNAKYYYINTPPCICKDRALITNQKDLIPVIDRMFNNLCKLVAEYKSSDFITQCITELECSLNIEKHLPMAIASIRNNVLTYENRFVRVV